MYDTIRHCLDVKNWVKQRPCNCSLPFNTVLGVKLSDSFLPPPIVSRGALGLRGVAVLKALPRRSALPGIMEARPEVGDVGDRGLIAVLGLGRASGGMEDKAGVVRVSGGCSNVSDSKKVFNGYALCLCFSLAVWEFR